MTAEQEVQPLHGVAKQFEVIRGGRRQTHAEWKKEFDADMRACGFDPDKVRSVIVETLAETIASRRKAMPKLFLVSLPAV